MMSKLLNVIIKIYRLKFIYFTIRIVTFIVGLFSLLNLSSALLGYHINAMFLKMSIIYQLISIVFGSLLTAEVFEEAFEKYKMNEKESSPPLEYTLFAPYLILFIMVFWPLVPLFDKDN